MENNEPLFVTLLNQRADGLEGLIVAGQKDLSNQLAAQASAAAARDAELQRQITDNKNALVAYDLRFISHEHRFDDIEAWKDSTTGEARAKSNFMMYVSMFVSGLVSSIVAGILTILGGHIPPPS